jgi:hypothetical protein
VDNVRIFYNITEKYWVELSHAESRPDGFYKVDISQLRLYDNSIVEGRSINLLSNFGCVAEMKYHVQFLSSEKAERY